MLMLIESKNVDEVMSFCKSDKVKQMCGLEDGFECDIPSLIRDKKNVFLIAKKDEKPVGFICLYPVKPQEFSIHVCLRTIGKTTKDLISMAFRFARFHLDAISIHAVYPKTARAVNALADHFKFVKNDSIRVAPELLDKYSFRVLKL